MSYLKAQQEKLEELKKELVKYNHKAQKLHNDIHKAQKKAYKHLTNKYGKKAVSGLREVNDSKGLIEMRNKIENVACRYKEGHKAGHDMLKPYFK